MIFPCSPPWWSSARAVSAVCRWRARGRGPATWHPVRRWSRHRSWAARTRRRRRCESPPRVAGREATPRRPSRRPFRAPSPRPAEARLPGGRGAERRPGRYGLAIQFEERPDDPELARLVESTVWINEAHPAYRRGGRLACRGLPHRAGLGAGPGLPRRRAGEGARLRDGIPRELGRRPRPPQAREASVEYSEKEVRMCRSIKTLHNFTPPATDDEIRASSLQFVRKLSGFTRPSKANELAFARAVDQVAHAARELLDSRHEGPVARSRR